jgi:uncharacterized protein YdiU (UPF0061 family)
MGASPRWSSGISNDSETLLTICARAPLLEALESYEPSFSRALCDCTFLRLGLRTTWSEEGPSDKDVQFANSVYKFMHASQLGFEQFFFDWYGGLASEDRAARSPEAEKYKTFEFEEIKDEIGRYQTGEPDALSSTYFHRDRPCTLLIDEIESIWSDIADDDDWSAFATKLDEIEELRQTLDWSPS